MISNYDFLTLKSKIRIPKSAFRIPKSALPNPQSAIYNPSTPAPFFHPSNIPFSLTASIFYRV